MRVSFSPRRESWWAHKWRRIVTLVIICTAGLAACGDQVTTSARVESTEGRAAGEYPVRLVAPLQTGLVGWCLIAGASPSGCPSIRVYNGPIVAVGISYSTGKATVLALTKSNVAAVTINRDSPVATRVESGLPKGLRVVAVALGHSSGNRDVLRSSPRVAALDSHGRQITQQPEPGKASIIVDSSVRRWRSPSPELHGICDIENAGLSGLSAEWGSVLTGVRSYHRTFGEAFLPCVNIGFSLGNWPLLGVVLLDAGNPGTAPGPLAAMRPISDHVGMFSAMSSQGPVTMRRLRDAWLVVAGGTGLQQRLDVLQHLRASIDLQG